MHQDKDTTTYHPKNYSEYQKIFKYLIVICGAIYIIYFLHEWKGRYDDLENYFHLLFGILMLSYPLLFPKDLLEKNHFITINDIRLEAKLSRMNSKHWIWERVMEIKFLKNSIKITSVSGYPDELSLNFYSQNQISEIKSRIKEIANLKKIEVHEETYNKF